MKKMNRFVSFIFQTDYFEGKRAIVKNLYFFYSIAGGMYHENYMRPWFKRFSIIHYTLSNIFVHVAVLISLKFSQPFDLIVNITCVGTICALINISVCIACTYKWRQEFQKLFDKMNRFFNDFESIELKSEGNGNYGLIEYKKYLRFIKYFISFLSFTQLFGKLIFFFVLKPSASNVSLEMNYQQHFLFPFPFVKSPTNLEYTLIYYLQVITIIPISCNFFGCYIFPFLFLTYMQNQITLLRREVKTKSDFTTNFIEQCYDRELALSKKKSATKKELLDLYKKRQICCNEFVEEMKKWIERYHKLFS